MTSNVTELSEYSGSGLMRDPMAALKDVISLIEDGTIDPNKILILSLETKNNIYSISWHQAGMKMSECLPLLDVAKIRILQEMGYIPYE